MQGQTKAQKKGVRGQKHEEAVRVNWVNTHSCIWFLQRKEQRSIHCWGESEVQTVPFLTSKSRRVTVSGIDKRVETKGGEVDAKRKHTLY